MNNIGVQLSADDKQLLQILQAMEGHLKNLNQVAQRAMTGTAQASEEAARALRDVQQAAGGAAGAMAGTQRATAAYVAQSRDARVEANLLRQANRQLAMQMTDVVTSVASGMPVWMVAIQQGGQIRDAYGGIGAAITGVARAIPAMINPVTAGVAAVGGLAAAAFLGSKEMDAYRSALILSGNAAGVTAGALDQMAARIGAVVGTQGRAAELLAAMAKSGEIGAAGLERFTETAMRLESVGGPAAEETLKQFAALGKEPVEASVKLTQQTNYLTVAILDQIKALKDQGREAEAAALAQVSYDEALKQRVPDLAQNLGYLETAWQKTGLAARKTWDFMLGLGRDEKSTPEGELAKVQASLANLQEFWDKRPAFRTSQLSGEMQELRDMEAVLQERIRLGKRVADQQAEEREEVKRWEQAQKDAERAAKAQGETLLRINGISSDYADQMRNLAGLLNSGAISHAKYHEEVRKLIASQPGAAAAAKAAADAQREANAISKAQAELLLRLDGYNSNYAENLRVLAGLRNAGLITEERYLELFNEELQRQPFMIAAAKAAAAIAKERAEARQAESAGIQKSILAQEAERAATLKSVNDRITSLQEEAKAVEFVRQLNVSLAEAIEMVVIARLRKDQQKLTGDSEDYKAIQREIEAREKLIDLLRGQAQRKADEDGAKHLEAAYSRAADQIEQALTDALMAGGKSGKEYIEGLFRTMVLKPVIQAIVQPTVANWMAQAGMGGSGVQAGAGGTGGTTVIPMGGAGNWLSAGSTMSSSMAMFNAGTQLGSTLQFSSAANSASALWSSGNYAQAAGTVAGTVAGTLPYIDAFMSAKAGKWGEAIGTGVGAYFGGPLGAMIGKMIGNIADTVFAGNAGTPHIGGYVEVDRMGGVTDITKMQGGIKDAQTQAALSAFAKDAALTLNAAAERFGETVNFGIRAVFESDNNDPSWALLRIMRDGVGTGAGFDAPGTLASDPKAGFEEFAKLTADVLRDTIVAMDLPTWAKDQLKGMGEEIDTDSLGQAVQSIIATQTAMLSFQDALKPLGGTFAQIAGLSSDALYGLAELSGGLDALSGNLRSYYQNFFSASEQATMETARIGAILGKVGLELPATREAFRGLVEQQMALGDAGRPAVAALLSVSGAFAELVPATQTVADSTQKTVEVLRSAADIAAERADLERTLLELRGDTAALRALDRAALDESNRALYDQIQALRDSQSAAAAAAEQERALADERARIAAERGGLERELLELQGETAALRSLDRAALDESNRALYDQIQALRDTQSAAAAAAEQERTLAADRQRVASERAGLERQLLQLQGNTAALRAQERASLDASNRALYDQILALQDAAAAAKAYEDSLTSARAAVDRALSSLGSAQNAVDAVLGRATDAYVSAQDRVASATARVAQIQAQNAESARQAALRMRELGQSLQDFVDGETANPSAAFGQALRNALAGDSAAMQQLPSLATSAIDASRASATTTAQAAIERARILAGVAEVARLAQATAVPDAPSKDPLAAAQADLARAQQDLSAALAVAQQIGAPLARSVEDLVAKFATAQSDLAAAQAEYARAQSVLAAIEKNTGDTAAELKDLQAKIDDARMSVRATVDFVAGAGLPEDLMALALSGAKTIERTIDFVAGSTLPADLQALAVGTSSRLAKTIDFAVGAQLPADLQRAVLAGTSDLALTVSATLASDVPDRLKRLLLEGADAYTATISAALAPNLPADLRRVLIDGVGLYNTTIAAVLDSAMSPEEKALLLNSSTSALRAVTVSASLADSLTEDQRALLMQSTQTVVKTVTAALQAGTVSYDGRLLLEQSGETVSKIVRALIDTSSLTEEQRSLLSSVTSVGNSTLTINGAVSVDMSDAIEWFALMARTLGQMASDINLVATRAWGGNGGLRVQFDRGSATGGSGGPVFAMGGVFTNGIVTRPTQFPIGLMGEVSPEAIMPLARTPDGALGVRSMGGSNAELVAEVRALREEVQRLHASGQATAVHTSKTSRLLERVTRDGEALQTVPLE